ncbi:hypothetical protein L7F22_058159 [Adiantum nelumboides]|nr:hypothetical protein [Adiantum nelumboides]
MGTWAEAEQGTEKGGRGLKSEETGAGARRRPTSAEMETYTGLTGGACAIGEQPIKGLLNPKAMARLAVGEALTNLVWAKVTALEDVKASGNWMYAAKLEGEGACMYDAAVALRNAMIDLKIAIDGGKDSLSMAAQAGGELVKAPGDLVISVYAPCPDITKTVTPDLKLGDKGVILLIDLAKGKRRLGGSALAQVFDQIGDDCPDVDDVLYLGKAFSAVQRLLDKKTISAGHDISDGGVVVALLEMAFSGNCGLKVCLQTSEEVQLTGRPLFEVLFAEELGLLLEIHQNMQEEVVSELAAAGVSCAVIGRGTASPVIDISVNGHECIRASMPDLRDVWEETSFMLERLQRLDACVEAEQRGMKSREVPLWNLSFRPTRTSDKFLSCTTKPKVAIIREEGSNGDREMSAFVYSAGFEPWDLSMSDFLSNRVSLQDFRGVVFVGGFSYADVLDSGKGWAATIRFNDSLLHEFEEFYKRSDTFSLGVCNGCQLMALLGWVPGVESSGLEAKSMDRSQPRFIHNESGRFECRFSSVCIEDSPAIMFEGMSGTTTGIWVAHGEGRALFPDQAVLDKILSSNLAPLRYCDDSGEVTEVYPFNPNGSPLGIAALCSPDGRHLAMMPHPERCFLMWQYPWYPRNWDGDLVDPASPSPWMRMFQNAREWCERH